MWRFICLAAIIAVIPAGSACAGDMGGRTSEIENLLTDAPDLAAREIEIDKEMLGTEDPFSMSKFEIRDEYRRVYCADKLMDAASDLSHFSVEMSLFPSVEGTKELKIHLGAARVSAHQVEQTCPENPTLLVEASRLIDYVDRVETRRRALEVTAR